MSSQKVSPGITVMDKHMRLLDTVTNFQCTLPDLGKNETARLGRSILKEITGLEDEVLTCIGDFERGCIMKLRELREHMEHLILAKGVVEHTFS